MNMKIMNNRKYIPSINRYKIQTILLQILKSLRWYLIRRPLRSIKYYFKYTFYKLRNKKIMKSRSLNEIELNKERLDNKTLYNFLLERSRELFEDKIEDKQIDKAHKKFKRDIENKKDESFLSDKGVLTTIPNYKKGLDYLIEKIIEKKYSFIITTNSNTLKQNLKNRLNILRKLLRKGKWGEFNSKTEEIKIEIEKLRESQLNKKAHIYNIFESHIQDVIKHLGDNFKSEYLFNINHYLYHSNHKSLAIYLDHLLGKRYESFNDMKKIYHKKYFINEAFLSQIPEEFQLDYINDCIEEGKILDYTNLINGRKIAENPTLISVTNRISAKNGKKIPMIHMIGGVEGVIEEMHLLVEGVYNIFINLTEEEKTQFDHYGCYGIVYDKKFISPLTKILEKHFCGGFIPHHRSNLYDKWFDSDIRNNLLIFDRQPYEYIGEFLDGDITFDKFKDNLRSSLKDLMKVIDNFTLEKENTKEKGISTQLVIDNKPNKELSNESIGYNNAIIQYREGISNQSNREIISDEESDNDKYINYRSDVIPLSSTHDRFMYLEAGQSSKEIISDNDSNNEFKDTLDYFENDTESSSNEYYDCAVDDSIKRHVSVKELFKKPVEKLQFNIRERTSLNEKLDAIASHF